jgi:hypothetical protein
MPIKKENCANCGNLEMKVTDDGLILRCKITKKEFSIFGDLVDNYTCEKFTKELKMTYANRSK